MTARRRAPALKIHRLEHSRGLPLPAYQSEGAAGFDLAAAVPASAPITIGPGERALVPTGLVFELDEGHEVQVRPRSGLAAKFGVTVLNSPGTIDADYRGEVAVILINLGAAPFVVVRGDRIAQAVVAATLRAHLTEAVKVGKTARGSGGFGSTGVRTRTTAPAIAMSRRRATPARSKVVAKPRRTKK